MMISEDFGAFTAHPWLLYLPVRLTAMQKAQRRCITPVTISTTTSW
jgi:hypothetical protein